MDITKKPVILHARITRTMPFRIMDGAFVETDIQLNLNILKSLIATVEDFEALEKASEILCTKLAKLFKVA